jgi:predicted amidohydrolase
MDKPYNLQLILEKTREAAGGGARLVVFPECMLTGYVFESREEIATYAEPADGPNIERVGGLASELGVCVVFGFLEVDRDRIFNAAALVTPTSSMAYRKLHLPHVGSDRFVDPGNRAPEVHDTPAGRIGIGICYDGAFPESSRVHCLGGCELIVLPTNWFTGADVFADAVPRVRAYENKVNFLACNRVGSERGVTFIGRSSIHDDQGRELAKAGETEEVILYAEVNLASAREKRIERGEGDVWINHFASRRPEFYGSIADPK